MKLLTRKQPQQDRNPFLIAHEKKIKKKGKTGRDGGGGRRETNAIDFPGKQAKTQAPNS